MPHTKGNDSLLIVEGVKRKLFIKYLTNFIQLFIYFSLCLRYFLNDYHLFGSFLLVSTRFLRVQQKNDKNLNETTTFFLFYFSAQNKVALFNSLCLITIIYYYFDFRKRENFSLSRIQVERNCFATKIYYTFNNIHILHSIVNESWRYIMNRAQDMLELDRAIQIFISCVKLNGKMHSFDALSKVNWIRRRRKLYSEAHNTKMLKIVSNILIIIIIHEKRIYWGMMLMFLCCEPNNYFVFTFLSKKYFFNSNISVN